MEVEEHAGRDAAGSTSAVWMEVEEYAGRDGAGAASAVEARRAKVLRGAESFISIESKSER